MGVDSRATRQSRAANLRSMHIPPICSRSAQAVDQTGPDGVSRTPKAHWDALVLSGGGVKGIAMLGCLRALQASGTLSKCSIFVGSSIGAVLSAVMACNRDLGDMYQYNVLEFQYKPDVDIGGLSSRFGLDSGANLDAWIKTVLGEAANATFESVRRTYGKTLVIVATNLEERAPVYLGPDTSPHMQISLALRMSCAVPLYMTAVKHEGKTYVDGCVSDNFPCEYARDSLGARRVLGVRFAAVPSQSPIDTLESYLGALLECLLVRALPSNTDVIELQAGHVTNVVLFKLPKATMVKMHDDGAQQAHEFLKKIQ
jgi:predicted acylesterase/phospholipase RssA